METVIFLIMAAPVIGLAVSMVAVGCEFVFNTVDSMPRSPEVSRPPSLLIPRKVDMRDQARVDAWLFRRGLH